MKKLIQLSLILMMSALATASAHAQSKILMKPFCYSYYENAGKDGKPLPGSSLIIHQVTLNNLQILLELNSNAVSPVLNVFQNISERERHFKGSFNIAKADAEKLKTLSTLMNVRNPLFVEVDAETNTVTNMGFLPDTPQTRCWNPTKEIL